MPSSKGDNQSPSSQATDQRERILDIAAHELRTPITSLKGHIQLLQRRLRNQPEREADAAELRKMLYQVERLNHHIDLFLSITHLTQGRFEMVTTSFDLTAEVRRIVEMINAGSSSPAIVMHDNDLPVVGEWDRRRINETLMALLTNAIKFSPAGDIVVQLERKDDVTRVEVHDRGPGVPQADRHRIFEPYVTGSNIENSGVGLGLYVASEAVKRHHGRIGVRSRRGGGSIFWFEVPLEPPTT
jgi:two-component system, chemotaxis family, CheB/CheR fusion protein